MWSVVRRRTLTPLLNQSHYIHDVVNNNNNKASRFLFSTTTTTTTPQNDTGILELNEVEKVLKEVRADDVKVIPVKKEWTDFMVLATGRSTWHVKNIAQALVYLAKQKQKGCRRMLLPSVQGQESGKWIVVDSGKVIVHALDEKARAYYKLEDLWDSNTRGKEPVEVIFELSFFIDSVTSTTTFTLSLLLCIQLIQIYFSAINWWECQVYLQDVSSLLWQKLSELVGMGGI